LAADTKDPNILPELTWKDHNIYEISGGVRVSSGDGFYLRRSFGYGWIYSGADEDSDFVNDDRPQEYSRTNNSAGDRSVLDVKLRYPLLRALLWRRA
jgi:hypothetical protein